MKRQRKQRKTTHSKAQVDSQITEHSKSEEEINSSETTLNGLETATSDLADLSKGELDQAPNLNIEVKEKTLQGDKSDSELESKVKLVSASCVCRPLKSKISSASASKEELEKLSSKVNDLQNANAIILEKLSKMNESYGLLIVLTALSITGLVAMTASIIF